MNKRNDLQWLRAVAILAVCGFHLVPQKIPYGFLGVDIFFVISGYLMTVILQKNCDILTFYLNRVKRIFPVYVFVTTILCIMGYFLLLPMDYDFFKTETIWSVFFVNNMYPIFHQTQYFEMVAEYKFLLHTWSLGVEIQFYLIAPFFIKFLLSRAKPLFWIALFNLFSFLCQFFVPSESISFGLVFCRIWQFLVGTFVYCYGKKDEKEEEETVMLLDNVENSVANDNDYNFAILSFLGVITICFYPVSLEHIHFFSTILRTLCTLVTGAFLFFNAMQPINLQKILDSFLVYIGDASFAIYLVHWPIIVYFKYFSLPYGITFISMVIVVIANVLFKIFEIPMRKLSIQNNLCFIAMGYSCILFFYCIHNDKESSLLNIIKQNEIEAKSCQSLYYDNCEKSPILEQYLTVRPKSEEPERYCSYKLNPNANKTVLITGNSFVFFHIRGILEGIKESKTQFKEAFFVTHPACSIIAGKFNYNKPLTCENYDGSFNVFLNATKPDFIIHSSRIDHFIQEKVTTENIPETDMYYKEFERAILTVAKFTSRLIIIEPNPISKTYKNPLAVAQVLRSNGSISFFKMSMEEHHSKHDPTWNRIKKVTQKCQNCILIPTEEFFCKGTFCTGVDSRTKLGMYCDDGHLTPRSSLCLKPSIIQAIDFENPKMVMKCDSSVFTTTK